MYMEQGYEELENSIMKLIEEAQQRGVSDAEIGKRFRENMEIRAQSVQSDNQIPDTTEADMYFVEGFITEEMYRDFPLIARDFLKHNYANIDKYNELAHYDKFLIGEAPIVFTLQKYLVTLMLVAAKDGEPYSVALMRYLYKTYFKREYKELKKYKTINVDELMAIEGESQNYLPTQSELYCHQQEARILTMCQLYGIKLEDNCMPVYDVLKYEWKRQHKKTKAKTDVIDHVLGVLGIYPGGEPEGALFDPSKIRYTDKKDKQEKQEQKQEIVRVVKSDTTEQDYLDEINRLRAKLREEQGKSALFKERLQETKEAAKELDSLQSKLEDLKEENAALRQFVCKITEESGNQTTKNYNQMKKAIQNLRIVIIGGNDNWLKKIKQEFPNWKYVKPTASPINCSTNLHNADMVYFFTETLGHSVYNTFIQMVRENKIPFGYLHGVNLDSNVAYIYADVIK